jgi:hypothetical protein
MNISATQAATAASYVSPATASPAPASTAAGCDGSSFSKIGSLMSQLSDLAQSDPAKAKQAMAQIATKLGQSSDPHLKELAAKFDHAAQTGDVSSLKPKGHGGGHHHHHATASGQAASYQASADDEAQTLESVLADALG